MHAFDRRTDERTDGQTDRILIARPRLHCMQRGKMTREGKFCTGPVWLRYYAAYYHHLEMDKRV